MIASMSLRWVSVKLCADADNGAPNTASASRTGTSRRNKGIVNPFKRGGLSKTLIPRVAEFISQYAPWLRRVRRLSDHALVILRAGQRLRGDDIVGPDPAWCADGKARLGARGEFAGGLVVAAQIGGLGGRKIGFRVISFLAIGHRQLAEAQRRLGLPCHRGAKDRNRFVGVRLIIRGHQRLPK